MSGRLWLAAGALLAGTAVLLGAFGAHALRGRLGADLLAAYQTGVHYQFFHALGLILIGLWLRAAPDVWLHWAGGLMLAGILLFCGSLYLLAVTGTRAFGALTPFGGAAFLGGWLCLTVAALR